jgi:hypothetical protein
MMKRTLSFAVIACAMLCTAVRVDADTTITVDPGAPWIGFMNVSNLPSAGGAYQFGSGWGTADLVATFSGPVLCLSPNTIGDPDPYWYTPSGGPGATGNKIMDASMYVEPAGSLPGQLVTFTGNVLSNTLLPSHTSVAFIKDFAPDYSSFNTITAPLTPGVFSISLATNPDPTRHVQYGFETIGPDVWITDVDPYGSVKVTAIPEPASLGLAGIVMIGCMVFRRRR